MLRLLPRSRWALLRLGLLAGLTLVVLPPRWWAAQARYTLAFFLKNRLRDRAGMISFADSGASSGSCSRSKTSPAPTSGFFWFRG